MSKSHHIDYSEMVFPWYALSGDLQAILFSATMTTCILFILLFISKSPLQFSRLAYI